MSTETKIFQLFFSSVFSMQVISSKGKAMAFVGGRYWTDDEGEINDLQGLIDAGNQTIYRNENQLTIAEDELDPMNVLRKKIIAEYLAEQAAQIDSSNDRGNTENERLTPQSTQDIAAVAIGQTTSAGAKLAALKK